MLKPLTMVVLLATAIGAQAQTNTPGPLPPMPMFSDETVAMMPNPPHPNLTEKFQNPYPSLAPTIDPMPCWVNDSGVVESIAEGMFARYKEVETPRPFTLDEARKVLEEQSPYDQFIVEMVLQVMQHNAQFGTLIDFANPATGTYTTILVSEDWVCMHGYGGNYPGELVFDL